MEGLVRHLITPLVKHPESISIDVTEGEASIVLELDVHEDDLALFHADDGRVLRNVRTVLSAAAGSKKATIDLADADESGGEE